MISEAAFGIGTRGSTFTEISFDFGFLPSQQVTILPTRFLDVFGTYNQVVQDPAYIPLGRFPHSVCKLEAQKATLLSFEKYMDARMPFIECSVP